LARRELAVRSLARALFLAVNVSGCIRCLECTTCGAIEPCFALPHNTPPNGAPKPSA
jgi:hypothetical protein